MILIIQVILIAALMLVSYQDYKYRAVSWIIFPLLFILFFLLNFKNNSFKDLINNSIVNMSFVFFLFAVLTIYFSIKHQRLVNISKGFIGWGDILFIICMAFLFSPLNFMAFYSLSLIIIIATVLISGWILQRKADHIPLAGMQAFLLLLLFISNWIFQFFKFYSDEWLVNILM